MPKRVYERWGPLSMLATDHVIGGAVSRPDGQSARKSLYTVDEVKRIVSPIARRWDVLQMWLFGSYARGEATPESDIDILVDPEEPCGYVKLAGLLIDLEEALGMEVDLQTTDSFGEEFLAHIAKDEILIYER
jgi:predicted nucleotidyltransferase